MSKRSTSILKNFGWGLVGDVFLFSAALFLMGSFAIASFSSAYLIAFSVLAVVLIAFVLYRRYSNKTAS